MRTCASCGRENPDEADFCSCGEYLRWEPTGFVKAVATPADVSAPAGAPGGTSPAAPAPPPPPQTIDPNVTLAGEALQPPPATDQRSWGAPAGPQGIGAGVQAQPGTPGSGDAPPGAAALTLRLPGDDSASPGPVAINVEPGMRVTITGTIRNQSDVVDNFDMWIRGLPEGWWTISPATAYLVPYGAGGTYEQEIQIHIHPPRAPEAQARPWAYEVVAESRAYGGEVVSAPASATIGPYFDVATELKPERASGRMKARYRLIVRNKANARTDVNLSAEDTDAECQFRFAEPQITLEPGNALECPFTVFPPRQIWLGRPTERRFNVLAEPVGVETPPMPPRMAVYRQKAWLPWWLAIVAPLAIILGILIYTLLPKPVAIPKLAGLKIFAAQQLLNKDGFVLSPKTQAVPATAKDPAGTVAASSPPAGASAKKGTVVTLQVYSAATAGGGQVAVPSLTGDSPGIADQALRAVSLALGAVSPQPLNPNGKISSQIPIAGTKVAAGTAIAVFLATGNAAGAGGAGGAAATKAAAAAAAAGAAGGAAGAAALNAAAAQAGTGSIVIPALTGDAQTAAGKLAQLGLQPKPLKTVANVPVNAVAGTVPAAGQKVAKGAVVDLLISTGAPELSYDNGQTITVVNPLTGKVSGLVPPGTGPQVEASWSPDGTHVIYSQNGQLVIDRPNVKSAAPFELTQPQSGVVNVNPAFAPTLKSLVIAYVQRSATDAKLCFATIGRFALNPSCTGAAGWDLGGEVDWAPDGQTVLVFGTRNKGANFGILAFHSNVAYSTQASDWGQGALQTDASTPGTGVFEAQLSPNGKQMALVAGSVSSGFGLYIVQAGQFSFTPQQALPGIQACQVAWRDDGQQLAVMQPHGLCGPNAIGTIVAVDPKNPNSPKILATQGAHPAWQPVPTGN